MSVLDEIGVRNQTDKSSLGHNYLRLYELLFRHIKDSRLRLVEIGVQFGHSLRTWHEYFKFSDIIGIDAVSNGSNTLDLKSTERINLILGDAYTEEVLYKVAVASPINIIIDDGSHTPKDQEWFVQHYSGLLADKGILIVEDIQTPDTVPMLAEALNPKLFFHAAIDLRTMRNHHDDFLFVAVRK
jgi:hypothetical protein